MIEDTIWYELLLASIHIKERVDASNQVCKDTI